ncbi:26S proteasome complex subunit SEM1 isoform b, partial [Daubentonia madagascariensis]
MSEKKQPVDLGLLEEDDEFEEFPAEDWAGLDEDEDAHVWEDNWDDDNVEDDFSNQLRATILLMTQVHHMNPHLHSMAAMFSTKREGCAVLFSAV